MRVININDKERKYSVLGLYSDGVKFLALSILMALYVLSIVFLYRYDVVENSLYFSFGFDSQYFFATVVISWFIGVFNLGILGDYKNIDSAYKFFSVMFMLMIIIPTLLLADLIEGDFHQTVFLDLVFVSIALSIFTRVSLINVSLGYPLSAGLYVLPFLVCSGYVLYMLTLYPGEITLISLNSVYELRDQASSSQGTFFKYFVGFLTGVAAPFCFVFGIYKRNVVFSALSIGSYILVYMSSGHKSAIITLFLMFLVYALSERLSAGRIILAGVVGMVLILIFDFVYFKGILAAFSFDRMIAAPSTLTILYYDHFQLQPKFYLSHSIFSSFINNAYDSTPQEIIGSEYFSHDWANVNFIGEGFANFGRMGVYIYLLFVIFIIKVYDFFTDDLPIKVRLSLFVPALLYLLNASPLTLMLSGGYVGLVFILFVRRKDGNR